MNHIYLALAWGTYFFLHSYLATNRVKRSVHKIWPHLATIYRLIYVIVSVIGLAGIGWLVSRMPDLFHFVPSLTLQVAGAILLLLGSGFIWLSFRQYSFTGFIGLRNDAYDALQTNGLLNYVRHPIYSGTILVVMGYCALSPTSPVVVSALCIFIYLPIGIYLEEQKLIEVYGRAYLDYRRRVPALLPKLNG